MRATAAVAISLILHCIPQKVHGDGGGGKWRGSGAAGPEAISISGWREGSLVARPARLCGRGRESRSPSLRSVINSSIDQSINALLVAGGRQRAQQRHFDLPGRRQSFLCGLTQWEASLDFRSVLYYYFCIYIFLNFFFFLNSARTT